MKVLIVEDEPMIAALIEESLRGAGYAIAGTAASVARALPLARDIDCDLAVLDIMLRGETVEPVARTLHRRGKPFLFLSGNRQSLAAFADVPIVSKPFRPQELAAAVQRLAPLPAPTPPPKRTPKTR